MESQKNAELLTFVIPPIVISLTQDTLTFSITMVIPITSSRTRENMLCPTKEQEDSQSSHGAGPHVDRVDLVNLRHKYPTFIIFNCRRLELLWVNGRITLALFGFYSFNYLKHVLRNKIFILDHGSNVLSSFLTSSGKLWGN